MSAKNNKGVIEIQVEFTECWFSPSFWKELTGEYPEVKDENDARTFCIRDLEKYR